MADNTLKRGARRAATATVAPIKSVADFLADAAEGFKGSNFLEALEDALPWADLLKAAGESIAPIRFVLKVIEGLTRVDDPSELARIAMTIAYQQSVREAIGDAGPPRIPRSPDAEAKERLRTLSDVLEATDFDTLNLTNATAHPSLLGFDRVLSVYATSMGYGDVERQKIIRRTRLRFLGNFLTLVSARHTAEKFRPLVERHKVDQNRLLAARALNMHGLLLQWQFHEKPVLGRERFALSHIYVEPEAELSFGNTRTPVRAGPISRLTLDLIADPKFRDAIVVEAPAGAGKSAFTMKLAIDLADAGLIPIRIQMRDLPFDGRTVLETLGRAVRTADEGFSEDSSMTRPHNLFVDDEMFATRYDYDGTPVCPYVLILDGWDELSISASEGFRVRLDRLMRDLRSFFFGMRGGLVRLILTGRPSREVRESTLLEISTAFLHLRAFTPEQVETLATRYVAFSADPPFSKNAHPNLLDWPNIWPGHFTSVVAKYREDFAKDEKPRSPRLEILGLPLLAHLAFRLMSEQDVRERDLFQDRTSLYRQLIDLTAEKAGKDANAPEPVAHQHRIAGERLRRMIQRTAAAITALGGESISRKELQERLELSASDLDKDLVPLDDNIFSRLIVSYYFRGGNPDLGCEFLHKSFREYLFAERIVEVLKSYPANVRWELALRTPYWKDFETTDPRHTLAHDLARLVAPQWVTPEVAFHVTNLLQWEIGRSSRRPEQRTYRMGDAICLSQWVQIREALREIWAWWAEGVHLRNESDPRHVPLIQVLQTWCQRFDQSVGDPIDPVRSVTIDSHLGDALLLLCANVHYFVAHEQRWVSRPGVPPAEVWFGRSPQGYVTHVSLNETQATWILFSPGGRNSVYWDFLVARINAAGWRPKGSFPAGADLRGADLQNARIVIAEARDDETKFDYANLDAATFVGHFRHPSFIGAHANGAIFDRTSLYKANFAGANLRNTRFQRAELRDVRFEGTDLSGASFDRAVLEKVRTNSSSALVGTAFNDCEIDFGVFASRLVNVSFDGSHLRQSSFEDAERTHVTFHNATLDDATSRTWSHGFES